MSSELHSSVARTATSLDKSLMFAVFHDKLKISEYGSIQYLKASDYKASTSRGGNNGSGSSPNAGRRGESGKPSSKAVLKLDEQTNKKLENIISKIDEGKGMGIPI
jgi:catalase (peroxidase I)